jgi:hypothetical protein
MKHTKQTIQIIFFLRILSLFYFLSSFNCFSQTKIEKIEIKWGENSKKEIHGKDFLLPNIIDQDFSYNKPNFTKILPIKYQANYELDLISKTKSEASQDDILYLNHQQIEIPTELEINYEITKARNKNFLILSFFPFVEENNVVYRINSIEFSLSEIPNATFKKKDYVNQSVLSDPYSDYFKISVSSDGIYKLDKAWFDENGIKVDNPNHINIYGNGFGKLPELNSEFRIDDLAKNAIEFVGDNDAIFENDEYFLFHAFGPHRWRESAGNFRRDLNVYSDESFYFIRISETDIPLRINEISSSGINETHLVTDFNHYDIYEQDLKNLTGGGQRWYGELFDVELSRTFTFSIPNILSSSPVQFNSSLATNAKSGTNTITFSVNGNIVLSNPMSSSSADYRRLDYSFSHNVNSDNLAVKIDINRSSPQILTYLDKIEINCRRNLIFTGNQLRFRDTKSVGTGNVTKYQLSNITTNHFVWDITNRHVPRKVKVDYIGNTLTFKLSSDSLREFVCSSGLNFASPRFVGSVASQNLHGLSVSSLIIVTHPLFLSEANRLAQIHNNEGTSTQVVTTEQVYNEFSSGMQDPTAIKTFVKMFYDRSNGVEANMPKNLLLFGDGTYDPKNRVSNNNNFVVTFQTQTSTSEDHISNLVTDDYFGMLDDNESLQNSDMMDVGVGRMIVSTEEQARQQVDKIVHYLREGINQNEAANCADGTGNCSSFGDWRLKCVNIADDEEYGYFINEDTEPIYENLKANHPEINVDKIYLDAYQQITLAGGERYPDVFDAITDRVQRGSMIINYVGHGGEVGVAEERVITIPQIQSWSNMCNLNLFLSATCEFTKFDDPARVSAGEWVYLNPKGGAIALMTTTRSVFFGVNSDIIKRFFQNVYQKDQNKKALTFGEVMMNTKNQAGANANKRSFNLIGDPALRIAIPEFKVVIDSINSFSPNLYQDTLEALSRVRIKGHVEDFSNSVLTDFNGVLTPTIFDKIKMSQTLGQNLKSPIIPFETQKNILYKGKASVKNGYFDFSFIVPKDINYAYGPGKISLYANSENYDAGGFENKVIIGGISAEGLSDNVGPEINLFLNDENFVDGGLTDENPILIAKLFDENGINTVGNGIGHDITAIIDEKTANPIVLNDYYNSDLDTYQSGSLRYNLKNLEEGKHTLKLKVWDVNNNSSESMVEFEVRKSKNVELKHVLNYPNPFTTNTSFFFQHNQTCKNLEVQIQIFTISGKLVKTINKEMYNECYMSDGISWDGRDDFGDQLARGVYIYNLSVTNSENERANKIEKLVLLK